MKTAMALSLLGLLLVSLPGFAGKTTLGWNVTNPAFTLSVGAGATNSQASLQFTAKSESRYAVTGALTLPTFNGQAAPGQWDWNFTDLSGHSLGKVIAPSNAAATTANCVVSVTNFPLSASASTSYTNGLMVLTIGPQ